MIKDCASFLTNPGQVGTKEPATAGFAGPESHDGMDTPFIGRPRRRRGTVLSVIATVSAGLTFVAGCKIEGTTNLNGGEVAHMWIAGQRVPDVFVPYIIYDGKKAASCDLSPQKLGSQLMAEDNFTTQTSNAGAIGPAQVVPADHPDIARAGNLESPGYATAAMAEIDCQDGQYLHGVAGDFYNNVLAAYNAGLNAVRDANGNVNLLPPQTQQYIQKIDDFIPTVVFKYRHNSGPKLQSSSQQAPTNGGSNTGGGPSSAGCPSIEYANENTGSEVYIPKPDDLLLDKDNTNGKWFLHGTTQEYPLVNGEFTVVKGSRQYTVKIGSSTSNTWAKCS